MSVLDLVRPEIRALQAYRPAEYVDGLVRLNANENPWPPGPGSEAAALNRYPSPRPAQLAARLAQHYGVAPDRLLVTRGSSEGIDVLIRSFCAAGRDEIVISPPTFGMYAVYAQIQGAGIRSIPLDRTRGYRIEVQRILSAWDTSSRLLFVCSPNNPTGNAATLDELRALCDGLAGRGVVVLDAAYAEFADDGDALPLLDEFDNLVMLRTLSKALGLAGVRCGVLLAPAGLVSVLERTLPPYCFPVTSQEAVLRTLDESAATCRDRIALLKNERQRLATALHDCPRVRRIWPSAANFLLVELDDAAGFVAAARTGGVLVRDFSRDPWTPDCVRITVGRPEENDQLLRAVQ